MFNLFYLLVSIGVAIRSYHVNKKVETVLFDVVLWPVLLGAYLYKLMTDSIT